MARLEGYRKFMKKDQSGMCFVITYSYTEEKQNCFGRTWKDSFLDEKVYNMLTPDMINKELTFDYLFDRGYPRIVGVSVEVNKK